MILVKYQRHRCFGGLQQCMGYFLMSSHLWLGRWRAGFNRTFDSIPRVVYREAFSRAAGFPNGFLIHGRCFWKAGRHRKRGSLVPSLKTIVGKLLRLSSLEKLDTLHVPKLTLCKAVPSKPSVKCVTTRFSCSYYHALIASVPWRSWVSGYNWVKPHQFRKCSEWSYNRHHQNRWWLTWKVPFLGDSLKALKGGVCCASKEIRIKLPRGHMVGGKTERSSPELFTTHAFPEDIIITSRHHYQFRSHDDHGSLFLSGA